MSETRPKIGKEAEDRVNRPEERVNSRPGSTQRRPTSNTPRPHSPRIHINTAISPTSSDQTPRSNSVLKLREQREDLLRRQPQTDPNILLRRSTDSTTSNISTSSNGSTRHSVSRLRRNNHSIHKESKLTLQEIINDLRAQCREFENQIKVIGSQYGLPLLLSDSQIEEVDRAIPPAEEKHAIQPKEQVPKSQPQASDLKGLLKKLGNVPSDYKAEVKLAGDFVFRYAISAGINIPTKSLSAPTKIKGKTFFANEVMAIMKDKDAEDSFACLVRLKKECDELQTQLKLAEEKGKGDEREKQKAAEYLQNRVLPVVSTNLRRIFVTFVKPQKTSYTIYEPSRHSVSRNAEQTPLGDGQMSSIIMAKRPTLEEEPANHSGRHTPSISIAHPDPDDQSEEVSTQSRGSTAPLTQVRTTTVCLSPQFYNLLSESVGQKDTTLWHYLSASLTDLEEKKKKALQTNGTIKEEPIAIGSETSAVASLSKAVNDEIISTYLAHFNLAHQLDQRFENLTNQLAAIIGPKPDLVKPQKENLISKSNALAQSFIDKLGELKEKYFREVNNLVDDLDDKKYIGDNCVSVKMVGSPSLDRAAKDTIEKINKYFSAKAEKLPRSSDFDTEHHNSNWPLDQLKKEFEKTCIKCIKELQQLFHERRGKAHRKLIDKIAKEKAVREKKAKQASSQKGGVSGHEHSTNHVETEMKSEMSTKNLSADKNSIPVQQKLSAQNKGEHILKLRSIIQSCCDYQFTNQDNKLVGLLPKEEVSRVKSNHREDSHSHSQSQGSSTNSSPDSSASGPFSRKTSSSTLSTSRIMNDDEKIHALLTQHQSDKPLPSLREGLVQPSLSIPEAKAMMINGKKSWIVGTQPNNELGVIFVERIIPQIVDIAKLSPQNFTDINKCRNEIKSLPSLATWYSEGGKFVVSLEAKEDYVHASHTDNIILLPAYYSNTYELKYENGNYSWVPRTHSGNHAKLLPENVTSNTQLLAIPEVLDSLYLFLASRGCRPIDLLGSETAITGYTSWLKCNNDKYTFKYDSANAVAVFQTMKQQKLSMWQRLSRSNTRSQSPAPAQSEHKTELRGAASLPPKTPKKWFGSNNHPQKSAAASLPSSGTSTVTPLLRKVSRF